MGCFQNIKHVTSSTFRQRLNKHSASKWINVDTETVAAWSQERVAPIASRTSRRSYF